MNDHIQNLQKAMFSAAGIPMPGITFESEKTKFRGTRDICIIPEFLAPDPGEALELARWKILSFLDIDPCEKVYIDVKQNIGERGHEFHFSVRDKKYMPYNGE